MNLDVMHHISCIHLSVITVIMNGLVCIFCLLNVPYCLGNMMLHERYTSYMMFRKHDCNSTTKSILKDILGPLSSTKIGDHFLQIIVHIMITDKTANEQCLVIFTFKNLSKSKILEILS